MSNPNVAPLPDDHLNYINALEVIREVSDSTVQKIGKETVEIANELTHIAGVEWPADIVKEAEELTTSAVLSEQDAVREAQDITAFATEVAALDEDLPLSERADPEIDQLLWDILVANTWNNTAVNKFTNFGTTGMTAYEQRKREKTS